MRLASPFEVGIVGIYDVEMIERTSEIPIGRDGGAPAPGVENSALFAVEVRDDGAPAGAASAVILHGGPGASHDYLRPQLDRLTAAGRHLLYYDQRGGGRSALPAAWPAGGIRAHLRDLEWVLASVRPARPALVGYSWGGLLALHLALEAPQAIDRLLLISPAPPNIEERDRMRERLAAAAKRPDVLAFAAGLDRTDRRQRFAGAIAGYFVDPARALEVTPFLVRERAERGVWDSLAGYDLRPRLPSLSVPTLILHGTEDPIPIEGAREIAALGHARLVALPRCGHVPYVEGGETFWSEALAFLVPTSR
jgi:pimeloyl-ACP methyl ester carboxylesterase